MNTNPNVIDQEKHKENSKQLGKLAAHMLVFFVAMFGAVWANVTYLPQWPVFMVVLVFGGLWLVPRTRRLMQSFEENRKG